MECPPSLQRKLTLPMVALLLGVLTPAAARGVEAEPDGTVLKAPLRVGEEGARPNLLKPDAWQAVERGFAREGDSLACDNRDDPKSRRGALQRVELNQTTPEPIVAFASSKAEGVSGSADEDYSLYLDVTFDDGSELWGQHARFSGGSHDWQRRKVVVFPRRPIKAVNVYLLFRGHGGKASFRDPVLNVVEAGGEAVLFDGQPYEPKATPAAGFQVRDVAAESGFVRIADQALGLKLEAKESSRSGATFLDVTLLDTTGKDRAVTLLYTLPVAPQGVTWFDDPRRSSAVEPGREYVHAVSYQGVGGGRLSTYPLAAVGRPGGQPGLALGIDMAQPAFYRIGYTAATGEFWIAFDLGLAPEKPVARLRLCRFEFDAAWGFRSALARYYGLFPAAFERRVAVQGLWMPFAKISTIKNWGDFHFRFKEGNDETGWDDEHGIVTFRYTEPLTWWMPMPAAMPRTIAAAEQEAKRLADRGRPQAKALLSSGYHNADGELTALFRDEPWNHGAVWSMNSMPGIAGEVNDFKTKWSPAVRERFYEKPRRGGVLDGEYVDSSEGYVTAELDFRRDHFAAADTPLVFASDDPKPAIFRGLIAFEYVRGIERDVHAMGKLMMANATPDRLCWLAPMLDVMGTETDWNPRGRWRPMPDSELLYRRALCKSKPYCFLMNSAFEKFPYALTEKYMKRALAYGMFPGFFSHNASEGHYFTRPELFDRDRPLFKKYLPLCKLVAESGWEPVTLARSNDESIHVERFGDGGTRYLTLFNDSQQRRTAAITLDGKAPSSTRDVVSGRPVAWDHGACTVTLEGEDIQVLELRD